MRIYALHDSDSELKKQGAFEIKEEETEKYNNLGYGIFWTLNEYDGRRKAKNITKINYWIADIDNGTKEEQMSKIKELVLKPSMIIESKNGFHCYWKATNATIDNYAKIERGIIQKLNADKACKDPVRLLRMPYFYHKKDINNPFLVEIVEENSKEYTEDKMLFVYEIKKPNKKPINYTGDKECFLDESQWDRLFRINQIKQGERNNTLAKYIFWLKDLGFCSEISYIINGINQRLYNPLEQWEVDSMLKSKGVL